jgi:hypothetical protein
MRTDRAVMTQALIAMQGAVHVQPRGRCRRRACT